MMNGSISVRGETIKSFKFTLEDGTNIYLNLSEAKYIRDYLNLELPKPINLEPTAKTIKFSTYNAESENKDKPIPKGYYEIFRNKSDPRNGKEPYTYIYYEDATENFGFQIQNGRKYAFVVLGKIADPHSSIGRFVRSIPSNGYVSRGWFKSHRIQGSDQMIKAQTDILEHVGYLKQKPSYDDLRRTHLYERTNKMTGLGIENNHDEPKEVHTIYPRQPRQ